MSACPWTWCSRRGGRGSRRWCTRTTPGSPLSPLSYPREPSLCRVKCLRVSLASVWNITTPEHFMLNLEFQFGLEGLCTVRSDGSDWLNLLRGDWLVYLQKISGDGEYGEYGKCGEYVNIYDTYWHWARWARPPAPGPSAWSGLGYPLWTHIVLSICCQPDIFILKLIVHLSQFYGCMNYFSENLAQIFD